MLASVKMVTLIDRVDWQLLRLRWPRGANVVEAWQIEADGKRSLLNRVNKQTFASAGGIIVDLQGKPAKIQVNGAKLIGDQYSPGGHAEISFAGRPKIGYQLRPTKGEGWRSMPQCQLYLEGEGVWQLADIVIYETDSALPTFDSPERLTGRKHPISSMRVARHQLVEGQLTAAGPPLTLTSGAVDKLSLSATVDGSRVMLSQHLNPVPLPALPTTSTSATCPECFQALPEQTRCWECANECPDTVDKVREQKYVDIDIQRKTITEWKSDSNSGLKGTQSPPAGVSCNSCGKYTAQLLCPFCHARLPMDWLASKLLTTSIVGGRSSGKTTYLWSLFPTLRDSITPNIGYKLIPQGRSAEYLQDIDQKIKEGILPAGTDPMQDNSPLRFPLLFSLDLSTKTYLSFFDSAGEDSHDSNRIMLYKDTLRNSRLVIVTIDMLQIREVHEALENLVTPTEQVPTPPEQILKNVIEAITQGKSTFEDFPLLAVMLTKFDNIQLAAAQPLGRPSEILNLGDTVFKDPYQQEPHRVFINEDSLQVDAECRLILNALGAKSFLETLDRYPGDHRLFAVSAIGGDCPGAVVPDDGISPFRVADPLRWALAESWR
jgi:hypothetical protein